MKHSELMLWLVGFHCLVGIGAIAIPTGEDKDKEQIIPLGYEYQEVHEAEEKNQIKNIDLENESGGDVDETIKKIFMSPDECKQSKFCKTRPLSEVLAEKPELAEKLRKWSLIYGPPSDVVNIF